CGSLGVDVETAVDTTLTTSEVTLIPTTANGPLEDYGSIVGGLLIGRSSTAIKGLIVLPGVIDADFTGNIKIMAYTLFPPIHVLKGSKIAQIVALRSFHPDSIQYPYDPKTPVRGDQGFGSTGPAIMFTQQLNHCPTQVVKMQLGMQNVHFQPLLDTGADVTMIS
ncbi:POK9 protein, partial [Podargus strigoides]|nr:POK9 protein [Podargus strigoides]